MTTCVQSSGRYFAVVAVGAMRHLALSRNGACP